MTGVFAGKFAFRSTDTAGSAYLTSLVEAGGTVYPAMSGTSAGPAEAVILYVQPDGSYVGVLAVPQRFSAAVSLAYFSGQAALGFVGTTATATAATAVRIPALDGTPSAWSILDSATGQWVTLSYLLGAQMPLLTYTPSPGGLKTLAASKVTPGAAALLRSKAGQRADLRYCDLSGVDLSGVDFTGADFTGADLSGAKLVGATLTSAVFTGAVLQRTDVTGATLDAAILSDLDLSTMVWGPHTSAVGTHFEGSLLIGVRVHVEGQPIQLRGAFFTGADLSGADFTQADLSGATLYGANLTGTILNSANLTGARLGGSDTDSPATLAYAQMSNVTLTEANLFGVNLTFVTLFGAQTRVNDATTIEAADFTNAYLEGVSFQGSNLQGARFDGACLIGAVFTGASLGASAANTMPASFAGACLCGASFTGASLAGVNFANAAVSSEDGSFQVRYCTQFGPMPPAPGTMPINSGPTIGLDLSTLRPSTVCPNGRTLASNQALGLGLPAMLAAAGAPVQWTPAACFYPGP